MDVKFSTIHSSLALPHGLKRLHEYPGVKGKALMTHVEELDELTRAVGPGRVISADDLPPTGDARFAAQELVSRIAKLVGFLERNGPGTNHGEIACQHVDELRQLIKRGVAQEVPNLRNTRVVI